MTYPTSQQCVGVLLPLAVEKPFTFSVSEELLHQAHFGMRVEVQFGKSRHYSGLIVETGVDVPETGKIKPILHVLDKQPLITPQQYTLWKWIASYYGCTLGEVMSAALPSNLKLNSETRILAGPMMEQALPTLNDEAYLIAEGLAIRTELGMEDVRQILNRKNIYPLLLDLLHQQVILYKEELQERFKPKTVTAVRSGPVLQGDRAAILPEIFRELDKAPRQLTGLMAYLQLEKHHPTIRKAELLQKAGISDAALKGLTDKGILEAYTLVVSRLDGNMDEDETKWVLSADQQKALESIGAQFEVKPTVLLQGITGSGKTLLYAELIRDTLAAGKQVLYLLPEIALTTQLILRLERLTGKTVWTYHSRLNQHERVEIWNAVMSKPDTLVVGPRSGLFLPWANLGLVIVDEEHDPSYKQHDPAPRYQARDTAIMLASLFKARTLLGSATPSIESYFHARQGKYGYTLLKERFGEGELPEMRLVNMRQEAIKGQQAPFSVSLLDAIKAALNQKEQVLLFQNRRGFAPSLRCEVCSWVQDCVHCDVSLTYHKPGNNMQCHYCGYHAGIPTECPQCGNRKLTLKGFGTQRIEDDLKIFFPEKQIERLDMDTTRSRTSLVRILDDFAERKIDILVGTQMITKGLDFDNIGLVGILQADQLMAYPDFRAAERAFQLMTQVAGRAGRKSRRSLVLIQTNEPGHAVMQDVVHSNLEGFYQRELEERKELFYPPFSRIIRLLIKHKIEEKVIWAADQMAGQLRSRLGEAVQGPASPPVARVGGYYLRSIQLKLGLKPQQGLHIKDLIQQWGAAIRNTRGMSGMIIQLDVDPM
jgi:primosomal protein N' (replication factor Y)